MEKKMTQHKVIADDSLSAMDEITKVLGKDAVILNTHKVNGKIEIFGVSYIRGLYFELFSNFRERKSSNLTFSFFSNFQI